MLQSDWTVQIDNGPKQSREATKEFLKAKKCDATQRPRQSPDVNPVEHAFQFKNRMQKDPHTTGN